MTGWELIRRALDRLESLETYQEDMEPSARLAMEVMFGNLWSKSPVGKVEPFHNRTASQRLGHTPIQDGWVGDVRRAEGNNAVQMYAANISQHVMFFIKGTQPHRIPESGDAKPRLTFYWEHPSGKHIGGPGVRKFKWVDHPGAPSHNLVPSAIEAALPAMVPHVVAGTKRFIEHSMEELS